jgi:hypothetical protein
MCTNSEKPLVVDEIDERREEKCGNEAIRESEAQPNNGEKKLT